MTITRSDGTRFQTVQAEMRGDACYSGKRGHYWHDLTEASAIDESSVSGPFPTAELAYEAAQKRIKRTPVEGRYIKPQQDKPMFLLIKRNKGYQTAQLVEDEEYARQLARTFVGDHIPADGCSTEPRSESYGGKNGTTFVISRSNSFGGRAAYVYPVSTEFEQEIR